MKKLEQIPAIPLLVSTVFLSAIPFLLVELFKSSLYTVMVISPYLVFHNVTEFFSVMVSFSIFGLGWYAYDQNNDQHSLFLSVSFLAIGLMDFMHTLGYAGMPALITPHLPNKATQFWIAVRFFSASVFLISAFISLDSKRRWISKTPLMTCALVVSSVVFIAIIYFPDYVPVAFVQGIGLTPFKVNSEYVIIFLLVLATIMYWQRLSRTGERVIQYYLVAFVICIFSELSFTLYKSAFDTYNMLGHLYKIGAFLIIYKGIFVASVRKPYESLNKSHTMLSRIINSIPQSLFWKDKTSVYLGCNQNFARRAGYDKSDDLIGLSDFDLAWSREEAESFRDDDRAVMERVEAKEHIIETQRQADGTTIWVDTTKVPLKDESGTVTGVLGVYEDITRQKQAEENLKQALLFNQQIISSAQEGIIVHDRDLRYLVWNPYMEKMIGIKSEDVVGKMPLEVFPFLQDSGVLERLRKVLAGEVAENIGINFNIPDSKKSVNTSDTYAPLLDSAGNIIGVIQTVRDITEQRKVEEQLHQSQKMESVGKLAGGVAHDFNNMLTVITGYAQLALMGADSTKPLYHYVEEIINASERSAGITKQLLAFSRQQTVNPKILDLNDTVSGLLKMLRQLMGEDIDLIWNPGYELLNVKIDPSQLDQIMANLCVNARDAISGVGKVAIQTGNFTLDETGWDKHSEMVPGEYVMLSVSDNGSGIPKNVINHIFEPFYTTKEVGKGTGLGLATVFGIVKQNKGEIKVYSEPGQGTTFRVYLPGITDSVEGIKEKPAVVGGSETILLVEDELSIMHLGTTMLKKLGYKVFSANSPEEAIQLADENQGQITLLITDIIMPGMNGRDLSEILIQKNPDMTCLFMSGYTADVISGRGALEEHMNFLQKPFNMASLSAKVREALIGLEE